MALLRNDQNKEDMEVQSTEISDADLDVLMDRSDLARDYDHEKAKREGKIVLPMSGPGWEVVVAGGANILSAVG